MFTGIITELAKVESIQGSHEGARLCIRCPITIKEAVIGDSIAVNGVCLTVTDIRGEVACFDVSRQTLSTTTTGGLKAGELVNLEPALRAGARLGGHFVSGHVEETGRILSRRPVGNAESIEIEAPESVLRYTVPKGSIAVDGISLTVVDVREASFTLVIIPHTLKMTTLGHKRAGDRINLEPDMLAKYVSHFISNLSPKKGDDKGLLSAMQRSGYL